jgi:hypothetical protein
MSFLKTGSPQPMAVVDEMCQICGARKAEFFVNGQSICTECKAKLESEQKNEF